MPRPWRVAALARAEDSVSIAENTTTEVAPAAVRALQAMANARTNLNLLL
jgi:hypothetical protein